MTAFPDARRAYPLGAIIGETELRDGWGIRTLDWPGDARRGSLLWLPGRGDFIEKHMEAIAEWQAAGWHIGSFDWRGQGGSGRLLDRTDVGHIDDFSTWIDDLAEYWTAWVARTPGPHVLGGHSMGGHLGLRALTEQRVVPAAAILSAPMLGFDVTTLLAPLAALLGKLFNQRPAWKTSEKPGESAADRQVLLTHDHKRYDDELWWAAHDARLQLGPPSWGWVAAAYRSVAKLDEAGVVEGLGVPVLVFGTDGDKLVSPGAIRRYAARMPTAELHMYDASVAHEILREVDAVRDDAMARVTAFLDRTVPAR